MSELFEPMNLMLAVVTVVVVLSFLALGQAGRDYLKTDVAAKKLGVITEVVTTAVYMAEQSGITQEIENKKIVALAYAETRLKELGVEVDLATLTADIEAAVLRNFPNIS